jgi:hypothetical protein
MSPRVAGTLVSLVLLLATRAAVADDSGASANALPGLAGVPVTEPLSIGAAAVVSSGYGYMGGVLGTGDSHHRAEESVAVSARPWRWLGLALRFDGRYTKDKDSTSTDDSFVSDIHIVARGGGAVSERLHLGGELRLWLLPGGSMPSGSGKATSVDFAALLAFAPVTAVRLAATAGFRLDNSASSESSADQLSRADRLALGISDAHAVLMGLGGLWRVARRLELFAEWTWDLLVGGKAPSAATSPMRIAAGTRLALTESFQLGLVLQSSPSTRPVVDVGAPLVPVEPRFRALVTLGYVYRRSAHKPIVADRQPATLPASLPAPEPPRAAVAGRVVGETGAPVAGARVTISGGGTPLETSTDADGGFRFEGVRVGPAKLVVVRKDHKRFERALIVTTGGIPPLQIALERTTAVGQLSGVTQSYAGKPVAATIRVMPGDIEVTASREGTFQIDLPPGEYTVTIRAPGFAEQQRKVKVERNGVTIMNIDLRQKGH